MSALTKSFNQAVLERARADRDFRIGLLEEAVGLYKSGEDAVGLKMVEQFMAAEGQAPAAGPWQPIETAPRDGSCILGFAHQAYTEPFVCWWGHAAYERGDTPALPPGSQIGMHWCITNCEDGDGILYEPTHWMPRPDPPKINTEGI